MKMLYFDCFSGISGDMTIGALIDAGGDPSQLAEELKKLHIDTEYDLQWGKVNKNGITSTKFDVILKNEEQNHESHHHHEPNHEYGLHRSGHTHASQHYKHHYHGHGHRTYRDIVKLIEETELAEPVKNTAQKLFKKIGEAEGHIHGLPLEDVHFHEVGAVDSIIDIVGTSILIHQLGIDVIKSAPIPVGGGTIHIDHGVYPVPAPATLEILQGVPIAQSERQAELTTPTGAAIAAVLADEFCSLSSMKVSAIGYGAGTKTFPDHPNVLRVIIGELDS